MAPRFINSSWLAKRYPELVLPDDVQQEILADCIAGLSPEKAQHFLDTFESGKRVYVNRAKAPKALVDDGRTIKMAKLREYAADLDPDTPIYTDEQEGLQPIGLVPGHGYYVFDPAAVAFAKARDAGDWD